jgi:hypothetical protein
MARKYSIETEDKYIAGLWQESFHSGLLWIIQDRSRASSVTLVSPKLPFTPSWSWISVSPDMGITYRSRFGRSTSKLLSQNVQLKNQDKFGAIISAKISIEARLKPLLNDETELEWPNEELDKYGYSVFLNSENNMNVYALDLQKGRILLFHTPYTPILVELDYGIPLQLESCYCIQINSNGFLLIRKVVNNDGYERISCSPWHEDKTLFNDCTVVEVDLI